MNNIIALSNGRTQGPPLLEIPRAAHGAGLGVIGHGGLEEIGFLAVVVRHALQMFIRIDDGLGKKGRDAQGFQPCIGQPLGIQTGGLFGDPGNKVADDMIGPGGLLRNRGLEHLDHDFLIIHMGNLPADHLDYVG